MLVEASMSSLDKSNNTISDLYKGLNIVTEILKEIKNAIKDDSAHALKQNEELAVWAKSSTNMAWNLGSRLSVLKSDKGKGITTELDKDLLRRLVHASTIVHPDLDALIPYTINEEVYHLTSKQLQEQMDMEELIKKAEEDARLLAISKSKVIKVAQEEAKKIRLDPRKIISAKVGEMFKKAQDAEQQVLKREHTKKPETITDIKIHPKTKSSGHDSLQRIIKIPEELGIKSALLAPAPEEASFKSSRKKRKHMELEPKIKIPGLECNQTLPKHVPFVNNMVIEEHEHEIFFTDEFDDQAFQR
nr:hypothetical protein [Tanacetum cinerariifolium]